MMDEQKQINSQNTVMQQIKKVENFLFVAPKSVTDERDRLRAYVTSVLMLVSSFVFIYGLTQIDIDAPVTAGTPSWHVLAMSTLFVVSGYVVSRTKYYQWGLVLAFVPMLVINYSTLFAPISDFSDVEATGRWILLPLLLAALLLPSWAYVLTAIAFLGMPFSLPFVAPPEYTQSAIALIVFLIAIAILVGFSARFQSRLQTFSLAKLQAQNLAEKEGIIERLQQAEALQRQRAKVIESSYEINSRLATILDSKELVNEVTHQIQELFEYNYVQLYLMDESGENLMVAGGTGEAGRLLFSRGHQIERGKGLVGEAAATNEPVLVEDVAQIGNWIANPLLPDTKSELAVPISVGENVLGVLDVQHNQKGGLTESDVSLLQSVATAVAVALQNARLYEQVNKRAEQEAIVNQINQQILSAPDIEGVLQVAAQELGRTLKAQNTTVQLSVGQKLAANGRVNGDRN